MMNNKSNKRVALTLTDSEWRYIETYLDTGRIGTNLAQLIRDHIKMGNALDKPYSEEDFKNAKKIGLDLDNWEDYKRYAKLEEYADTTI